MSTKSGADAGVKANASKTNSKTTTSAKAPEKQFFAPAKPAVQTKLKVGSPNDPAEKEADHMANKVMNAPAHATHAVQRKATANQTIQAKMSPGKKDDKIQKKEDKQIQKKEDKQIHKKEDKQIHKKEDKQIHKKEDKQIHKKEDKQIHKKEDDKKVQRKSEGTESSSIDSIGESLLTRNSGSPLKDDTRSFMEQRFNADFSNVRIHTGTEASQMNNDLGAKAFTYQNNIYFNQQQYQPGTSDGKHLLAHELTHVVQQGQSTVMPQVQRFLGVHIPSWQDVIDWLAEKAYNIPGFRMFTIVIGVNPINGETADRSAANILRAIVEFLPGGHIITQALEKYNVFEKAGAWVEGKLKRFSNLMGTVKSAIKQFTDDLDFLDIILHPIATWEKAVHIFSDPVNEIISFIQSIFQDLFQLIRDAVLKPLAGLAANAPGYDLLCAVLGFNPITGESVPRNADTLIGGFMKMIGRPDIWENIKKGNAIQRAYAWFLNAMKGLISMVKGFKDDFIAMLKSLEIMDFIILPNLFSKVFKVFGNFAGTFANWALDTIFDLLEIIFSVVAPGAMPYLAKVRGAFKGILEKPMVFVGHLIDAAKKGFLQFKDRIGQWLKKALLDWLLGSLKGADIYIPQAFTLKEILKLVLSVFGLTWQNIRGKLVKAVGETAVVVMEQTVDVLDTLIHEGPAAAWQKIQDKIEELKAQFISEVTSFVTVTVVQAAVTKLLTSLNPAGAFIQAILAIWNTIQFLIQKIQQIAAVGMAVVDSIVEISSGAIGNAANKVENVLGGMLSMAISFLANFIGLGKVSDKVVEIIKKLRAPVDKAIDKVIEWILSLGKSLVSKVKNAVAGWLGLRKDFTDEAGENHSVFFKGSEDNAVVMVASYNPQALTEFIANAGKEPKNKKYVTQLEKALEQVDIERKKVVSSDKKSEVDKKEKLVNEKISKVADILSKMKISGATKEKMDLITVKFERGNLNKEIYDEQLGYQTAGLNGMTIARWFTNRSLYEMKGRDNSTMRKVERQERNSEAARRARVELKGQIKPSDPDYETALKAATREHRADIRAEDEGQAYLHTVDGVAGGDSYKFSGHGDSEINSDIGSQWPGRLEPILEEVKKIKPEVYKSTNMNVKLIS
ncbi:DUF4157 domain-containing protein [Chitinophaga sp. Cy-1792]|uniref:eCIS core domain-containing protein n=1 Tax=Chitinophaga sp. Cy-1792 TaxID=2608339 RepID=UPI001422F3F3|nr:DUF4157 domain-containing protein [Chitinophaga sp. Cy-1792]NIG53819.1 DUF4157 domain-containing protein [Chitinophaga sp. Cy-1792]